MIKWQNNKKNKKKGQNPKLFFNAVDAKVIKTVWYENFWIDTNETESCPQGDQMTEQKMGKLNPFSQFRMNHWFRLL